MALDPIYGNRVRGYAENMYPQAFAPPPQLDVNRTPIVPPAAAQGAPGSGGFPAEVLRRQGSGPKLTAEQLNELKEQYLTETFTPREAGRKGVTKQALEANTAAFNSKADRWIADYLKTQEDGQPAVASANTREKGLGATGRGLLDATVAAVRGVTTDTVSGLFNLADYGVRKATGSQTPTGLARAADAVSEFGTALGDRLISEETKQAREGLRALMGSGASASEVANYIYDNPSAAADMLGQTVGFIAPALATGGVSAAARGSALAGRLAQGGRVSRMAGRAVENAPAILSTAAAPTGEAIGGLRRQVDAMPLDQLLASDKNKALYESLQELGLSGERLNRRFRDAIYSNAEGAQLAGAAAANVLLPGLLGAPAERALAGLATRQGLGQVLRTGAAEAGQEAAAAVPETVLSNVAQGQVTGQPTDVTQGLGTNALLGAGMGALIGAGASAVGRPRNPLVRQPPPQTPPEAALPQAAPVAPTPEAAGAVPTVPTVVPPGPGIEEAQLLGLTAAGLEAAKLSTAGKTTKAALRKLDGAGIIAAAQELVQETAAQNWAAMNAVQRIDAIESVAEELNKVAKKDIAPELATLRSAIEQPPPTPAGTVPEGTIAPQETTPAAPAVEPPIEAATPAEPEPVAPQRPTIRNPLAATPPEAPALPRELAGAKPRYNNGAASYEPQFESAVDKALYIVGQKTKSKSDEAYRGFLRQQGFTDKEIDDNAVAVRESVRAMMEQSPAGTTKAPARVVMPAIGITPNTATPKPRPPPSNPLKKETQRPKSEAPAAQTQPGQATTSQAPQPTNTAARESSRNAAIRILPEGQTAEIEEAIELAREGDTATLENLIREYRAEGDITPAQARELREAGRSLTAAQEGLTEAQPSIDQQIEQTESADAEQQFDVPEIRVHLDSVLKEDSIPPEKKVGELLRRIAKDRTTTKYQKWLSLKLAPIMDSMEVTLAPKAGVSTAAGTYHAATNVMGINEAKASTIIHEALHAATSSYLLVKSDNPQIVDFQKGFRKLYSHGKNQYSKWLASPNGLTLSKGQQDRLKGAFLNERELITYALTDPSARDVFAQLPPLDVAKEKNLWESFKNLLAMFWKEQTNASVNEANYLNSIIDLTSELVEFAAANPELSRETQRQIIKLNENTVSRFTILDELVAKDEKQIPANVDVTPPTMGGRILELLAQAGYGLERSEQQVRKGGGTVTAENSPYYASRKYTSDIAENRNTDNLEVVAPLQNWIAANWQKFRSRDIEEFRKDLDKFLQNYHALNERNRSMWAENVGLQPAAELRRARLIDDAYAGKMTGPELQRRLVELAEANATATLEEWAKANARSPDKAREVLDDVAKRGFTPEALSELNVLIKAARDQARKRMNAAGITSPEDPFADRGWEWYVPLKGALQAASEDMGDYDIGARRGTTAAFRNRNLSTIEGRRTDAGNALEQLIVDMNQAAQMQAEGEFKQTLFQYVLDNQKLLGAQIRRWEGTPKQGYTTNEAFTKSGRKIKKVVNKRELKAPADGFIYNNGTDHFEVRLPKGSQLMRGLTGMQEIATPARFELSNKPTAALFRAVGETTNILSRAYTTWNPVWQLSVGFLRDIQALPVTVAMEVFDRPWQARVFWTEYLKNITSNVAQIKTAELRSILGNESEMRKYAELNPDSYIGKLLAYRAAGGSTHFEQGLNRKLAEELLFEKARTQDSDILSVETLKEGYNKWNALTSNWAQLLENKGRVAAWEALQKAKPGMTQEEAAAIVKGTLDYGQSGQWGKMINMWHAFFRIGATSTDTLRRAMTTPTGEIDKAKAAWWGTFMGAMGAMSYAMLAMALGEDEEGEPRIHKLQANTLTQKLVLPWGDKLVGYPIGLGAPQLTLAPGILGAAVSSGHISPAEAANAYYDTVTRNGPLAPAGWKKGTGVSGFVNSWLTSILTPTAAMPFTEVTLNTNNFDSPIHTEFVNKDKFRSDQGMPNTPDFWKERAKEVRELTGGMVDVFPEDIRHFVKAWGGQPASEVIRWTMDKANKEEQGLDSAAIRTALRTAVMDEEFYYRNEARQAMQELAVSKRLMRSAVPSADDDAGEAKWLRANPNDAKRIKASRELDKAIDAHRERLQTIKGNKLYSQAGKQSEIKKADAKLRAAVDRAKQLIEDTE